MKSISSKLRNTKILFFSVMTALSLQSSFAQVPGASRPTLGIAPLSYEAPELAELRAEVQGLFHGINYHPLNLDERCRRIHSYVVQFVDTCALPYNGYGELKQAASRIKAMHNETGEHEMVTQFVQRVGGSVAACDVVLELLAAEIPAWTENFPRCFEDESAPTPQPRHAPIDFQSNQSVSV